MKGEMNVFDDAFGKGFSVANLKNFGQFYLTFPDFQKGYALRSELVRSHLGGELKHFHFTVPNEDILYALRREFGWSHLDNQERGTRRQERLEMLKAEIAEGRKELEGLLG